MMLDGSAAISRMAPGTKNTASACLYTVWVALGCPHTLGRLAGHTFATATEAYQYTTKRHTDRNPPAGVPVWFGSTAGPRYAGDTHWPDGDVALSVGNGFLYGTDYPTWGRTGKCTIAQREQQTGRVYLGWTEDFLGNDVAFTAAAGGTATILEDDLMATQEERKALINELLNYPAFDGGPTLSSVLLETHQLYNAIFNGGPDLPDGGASIGQSLAVIHAIVGRQVERQVPGPDGKPVTVHLDQIQDAADTNTMVRALLAKAGLPASWDVDALASAIVAKLPESASPATAGDVTQAVQSAISTLTLKATS